MRHILKPTFLVHFWRESKLSYNFYGDKISDFDYEARCGVPIMCFFYIFSDEDGRRSQDETRYVLHPKNRDAVFFHCLYIYVSTGCTFTFKPILAKT
jgi:hypothetical protein